VGGVRYLRLEALIELKLASGMSNPGRLEDLADVQELIRARELPLEFGQRLDASVRDAYAEIWSATRELLRRLGSAEGDERLRVRVGREGATELT
jgi:hypothetical protein